MGSLPARRAITPNAEVRHGQKKMTIHEIMNDESRYCEAVNWMGAKAQKEDNHTYEEDGKVWHKNTEELIADGYLERYLEHLKSSPNA